MLHYLITDNVWWLTDLFQGRLSRLLVAQFVLFSTQLLAAHIFIIFTIKGYGR